jgi:hypothetical protein
VKGVGRWTAQMFLMFRLGRPNVLPELDLGIRKAIQRAYRLRAMPDAERVRKIGADWAPYATIACWYLWRSLEAAGPTRPQSARGKGKAPAAAKRAPRAGRATAAAKAKRRPPPARGGTRTRGRA